MTILLIIVLACIISIILGACAYMIDILLNRVLSKPKSVSQNRARNVSIQRKPGINLALLTSRKSNRFKLALLVASLSAIVVASVVFWPDNSGGTNTTYIDNSTGRNPSSSAKTRTLTQPNNTKARYHREDSRYLKIKLNAYKNKFKYNKSEWTYGDGREVKTGDILMEELSSDNDSIGYRVLNFKVTRIVDSNVFIYGTIRERDSFRILGEWKVIEGHFLSDKQANFAYILEIVRIDSASNSVTIKPFFFYQ